MAKITRAQERAFSLAFRAAGTPDDQQDLIKADLAKHGVVRDTAQEWLEILAKLDEGTRRLVRFEINVQSGAAQLTRSAARFAAQPSQGLRIIPQTAPQVVSSVPEPARDVPKTSAINEEAVNAWLADTGIKEMAVVEGLTLKQKDTLARIAQINRRTAYLLVTHQPLISRASPGEVLDHVRTLMNRGSRDWVRLFDDAGLFSNDPRFIRRALRVLDTASRTAATASGRGLKIKSSVTGLQWQSLPQDAKIFMERRLRQYLDKKDAPIDAMARTVAADIVSPGDELVEVITASAASPAFGIFDPKEFFARRQIRPFQLLLAAKEVGARSVRFVLYGEPLFDEKYAEKLQDAARELQLGVVIVQVDHSTGATRYLFGETPVRAGVSGAPDKQLPPISMPRRLKMKAPPPTQTEATTPKPDKGGKTFADYFRTESMSSDPAAVAWTVAMRRTYNNASLPSGVRDVMGSLLGQEGRSITPEAGLQMLDEAVWKEVERIFSRLDRTDAASKALLEDIPENVEPSTFEEVYALKDALVESREEFEALRSDADEVDREWSVLHEVGSLVHPARVAGLFTGTLAETDDIYGNDYLTIEDRLQTIETRLLAAEAGLSEAMMSISVRDFLTNARRTMETITVLRTTIARAGGVADELAKAVAEQRVVTSADVFDVASMTHEPFPKLDGVAGLKRELAKIIDEAGRYKDAVEGNAEFVEALESVVAETRKLMEEMAAVQLQYDTAKAEHAGAVDRLRQMARAAELSLEPTDNTGLPPPLEVTEFGSRKIEGVGDLRLKHGSEAMRQRVSRRDKSFESFNSARALVVRGKAYLVDANAVGAVSKWLRQRDSVLILRDMLGQRIEIPQHYYGVRMVKVSDLPKEHPFARISAIIGARYCLSTTAMDLMLALFSGLSDQGMAEIWRRFLSTAAKIAQDSVSNDGEGDALNEVVIRLRLDRAILSLYEGILEIPSLASFADRWFRFGDLDVTLKGEFRPISNETLARAGEMSAEEMTRVIEETGLFPDAVKDRSAWVDEWTRAVDRSPIKMLWPDFAEWYERFKKKARYLPEPFKFVGAIVNKADDEDILLWRMAARQFAMELQVGRLADEKKIAHFALLFLSEHQRLIADIFRDNTSFNGPDEIEMSDDDPLELLARREAFSGHDVRGLAALARAFLRVRGRWTEQIGEILGDSVAAMFGRLLMHKDALMIHRFSGLIAGMLEDLPEIKKYLSEQDPSSEFYGEETVESNVFDRFSHSWSSFERMLGLEPLEFAPISDDIDRAIELVRSGGSGGGDFTPSGSDFESGPGGLDPASGDENGNPTALADGFADGIDVYLQGEAAMGAVPLAFPIRPVLR